MDVVAIASAKKELEAKFGKWTAHRIHLADGVYTRETDEFCFQNAADLMVRLALDITGKEIRELRVLDLGCLEGGYAIQFAQRGAEAVGIEIRRAHVEKAQFVKQVLGLDRLTFVHEDVRNLSAERFGTFDVVICAGILYHLDHPDVFKLLRSIGTICRRAAIVDTHVALAAQVEVQFEGEVYQGRKYPEFAPNLTPDQKERDLWAAIDNNESLWLTRDSLLRALHHSGFTSVFEALLPFRAPVHDRCALVAVKGPACPELAVPIPVPRRHYTLSDAYQRLVKSLADLDDVRVKEVEAFLQRPAPPARFRSAVRRLKQALWKPD